jgi:hypothetical protein
MACPINAAETSTSAAVDAATIAVRDVSFEVSPSVWERKAGTTVTGPSTASREVVKREYSGRGRRVTVVATGDLHDVPTAIKTV